MVGELIAGARRRLTKSGVLWMVAQEQVPIGRMLAAYGSFAWVDTTVSDDGRFVTWSAGRSAKADGGAAVGGPEASEDEGGAEVSGDKSSKASQGEGEGEGEGETSKAGAAAEATKASKRCLVLDVKRQKRLRRKADADGATSPPATSWKAAKPRAETSKGKRRVNSKARRRLAAKTAVG